MPHVNLLRKIRRFVTGAAVIFGGFLPQSALSNPSQAEDTSCPSGQIVGTSYQAIEAALRAKGSQIDSVPKFLACLPDEFFHRNNHIFVIKSDSPEAADVSPEHPRVSLSNNDASTAIAYTGKPDGLFANTLRIIAAEKTPVPYNRFIDVTFKKGQQPQIDDSGDRCGSCHDGHHVWGPYRNWPNTFAKKTDLEWRPEERDGYMALMQFWLQQADSPYYKRVLSQQRGDHGIVAAPSADFKPRSPYAPGNSDFLDRALAIQAQIIQGKMKQSPLYQAKKHLLAGTYLGCMMPTPVKADMEDFLRQKFEGADIWKTYQTQKERLRTAQQNDHIRVYENSVKNLRIFMLSELMGAPYKTWPLTLKNKPNPDILADDGPAYDSGSGRTLLDLNILQIRQDFLATNSPESALHKAFMTAHWSDRYGYYINARYQDRVPKKYPAGFPEECNALAKPIANEPLFADIKKDLPKQEESSHAAVTPSTMSPATLEKVKQSFQKYCVSCHGANSKITPLPLHDLGQLAKYGSDKGKLGMVEEYLRKSMPPADAKLQPTDQERADMRKALSR